jgi:hypothetical protein
MAVQNPPNASLIEDLGHVTSPSKHFLFVAGADLDITNTAALGAPSVGVYVGGLGNITLTDVRGTNVTYVAVAAGTFIKGVFVAVVNATTTATQIVVQGK